MRIEEMHRPTPEFRAHLEWEVTSAFRRDGRLAVDELNARKARRLGWVRAAAVVLVSIAIGTTAGLASAQIRESAQRDSLLEAARADASIVSLRLELARAQFADAKRRFDAGAAMSSSLAKAESELRAMEAEVMKTRYNIEEMTSTARPPRDDLNAPLVGGRDFVRDRIQLELMAAQKNLTAVESSYAEAERRVRVGAASDATRLEAEGDLVRARAAMALLAERLNLRREFVDKGTAVEELAKRLRDAEVRQDTYVAQQSLSLAREQLALLERQLKAGVAGELDVMKAQLEMKERETELRRLVAQLKAAQVRRDSVP